MTEPVISLREIVTIKGREFEFYTYTVDSLTWYAATYELGYVPEAQHPLPVTLDIADTAINWHWLQDVLEHERHIQDFFIRTFLESLDDSHWRSHAPGID